MRDGNIKPIMMIVWDGDEIRVQVRVEDEAFAGEAPLFSAIIHDLMNRHEVFGSVICRAADLYRAEKKTQTFMLNELINQSSKTKS